MRRPIRHIDPNTINYLIFSEKTNATRGISLEEPFIMEGMLLGLCLKGTATIKINFREFTIHPGYVLAILPTQIVRLIEKSEDFFIESLYISFDFIINMPLPQHFDVSLHFKDYPCLPVADTMMQNLLEYFSFIVKQYSRADIAYRDTVVKGLLYSLLTEFIAIYRTNETDKKHIPSTRKEELTEKFLTLLMTHFKEERSVEFYADKLFITRKHLSKTVKDITGRSVMDWIHIVLIANAKMQLRNSKKTVSEISEELNISNLSFFCRLFKDQTGVSPLEYRNI